MESKAPESKTQRVPEKQWICGLDIAARTFTATLINGDRVVDAPRPFDNAPAGYRALIKWLGSHGVPCPGKRDWPETRAEAPLVVMEATGVYWEECAFNLYSQGYDVNVVNPARVKYFGQSQLRRAKTDKTDANLIAQFARRNELTQWTPPDPAMEALQIIMRQREALLCMLTEEQNRLHALEKRPNAPKSVLKTTREHIQFLERKIDNLEDDFKNELKKSQKWTQAMDLLMTIPGIGFITAAVMLTETQGLETFASGRQLGAYAGITPSPRTSGTSVRGQARISKLGNSRLRSASYMAALSAARTKSPLGSLYQRLLLAKKPKKVALVAVAHKLLSLAFAVVKSGTPYNPAFVSSRPC